MQAQTYLPDSPTLRSTIGFAQATVPNSAPIPAVTPMAKALQNVTRITPVATFAPPTRAANPPKNARNNSEAPETQGIRFPSETNTTTKSGKAARGRRHGE